MCDPIPAISESEASGLIAEIYADIRRVYRVGVVIAGDFTCGKLSSDRLTEILTVLMVCFDCHCGFHR